jgi:AcrR family transcriptional regulator
MRKRAEDVAETRQRIVDAAVRLHGSVGPAATTIAGIAEEAGVTRLTVYRHFPDDEAMFAACSAHWQSAQRLPQPQRWAGIADPAERLRVGLTDLYRFYRDGQGMLRLVHRDRAAIPEPQQAQLEQTDAHFQQVLLEPFPTRGQRRELARAVVGHAIAFTTWQSLCAEHGLTNEQAVDAMVCLVTAVVEGC